MTERSGGIGKYPPRSGSPRRIQRKRTKGWRKPEGAVNVCRPSIWGNPGKTGTEYRDWLDGRVAYGNLGRDQWPRQWVLDHVHELRGKDLMCWCPPGTDCHADVLLEMANATAHVRDRSEAEGT